MKELRASALVLNTYCDLCIGPPVRRRHLVSEPGCDSFSGAGTILRHRLDHIVHTIQHPLGSILVVGQKGVGLREETGIKQQENQFIVISWSSLIGQICVKDVLHKTDTVPVSN